MKYDNDIAPQMIKCPSCGTVQAAIVEFTLPWQTFIHECVKCKYTIMESEWEEIKPYVLNPYKKAHDHGFINGEYQSLNISRESSWNEFKKLNNINKEYEPLNDKI